MNIKLLRASLILLVLFTSFACKKEKIEMPVTTYSETPVFSVSGTIGGSSILFQAGTDGAYLENFNTIINGVNRYGGRMIQGDNYVEIALFDGNLSLPDAAFPTNSTTISLSQDFSLPLLKVIKSSLSNQDLISELQFTVNGEAVGNELSISEPGIYEVCTNVSYFNGSSKEVCNEVIVGYRDLGAFNLKTTFSGQNIITGEVISALPISSIDWYLNGVFQQTSIDFYQPLSTGLKELTAKVHFANGITRSHSVIVDGTIALNYLQDLNSFKSGINDALYQDFKGEISILKDGVLYEHVGGSGNSNIIVTNYSYYGKSPNGVDIYKISGIVSTQMKNMTTNEVVSSQFSVVFGLEIP